MTGKMYNNFEYNVLSLDKSIQPYVRQILQNDFGVLNRHIQIKMIQDFTNQFELLVPYAEQIFRCDVIFNLDYPCLAPDFIFHDNGFLSDPNSNDIMDHIPSLANWDVRNPNALWKVIEEVIEYYKEYQINMCCVYCERFRMEYEMFSDSMKKMKYEVFLNTNGNKAEAQLILILDLNYADLPHRNSLPIKDMVVLKVTCQDQSWQKITPLTVFTEDLSDLLNMKLRALPSFTDNQALLTYVPELQNRIQSKIDSLVGSYRKKREFVAILSVYQKDNILEYNDTEFNYIALLVEIQSNYSIVTIRFPDAFPEKKPEVMLHSVNTDASKPIPFNKFQYDSHMSAIDVARSIMSGIHDHEVNRLQKSEKAHKHN